MEIITACCELQDPCDDESRRKRSAGSQRHELVHDAVKQVAVFRQMKVVLEGEEDHLHLSQGTNLSVFNGLQYIMCIMK